ncbi:MAG: hypothetical protein CMF58_01935 [Lentimicrobiaceae bacterium]|jgi:hypothetical protein|nr:hypothetical protein [Lentimicrobiaceae bacterium]
MHLPIVFYICSKNINITHTTIIIMKKLLILIALPVLALILTLSSCSKDKDDDNPVATTFTEKYNNTYWSGVLPNSPENLTLYFSTDIVIKRYLFNPIAFSDSSLCETLNVGTFSYTDVTTGTYEQTTSIVTNSEDNYSFKQMSTSGESYTFSATITDNKLIWIWHCGDESVTDTLTRDDNFSAVCGWNHNNIFVGCD